jgi:hypothetical protein
LFGIDGSLTFPDNTTQSTASVKGDKGDLGTKGDTGAGTKGDKGDTGPNLTTTKFGYSSGASVTQTGSRGNGVTLNALSGEVTLVASTMTAGDVNIFTMSNDQANTGDMVICTSYAGSAGTYLPMAYVITDGQIAFWFRNLESFTTGNESPIIKFMIIKAAAA